jgi:hypothetical protein
MTELNTLFPGTDVTLSDGSTVTIKPLLFGQFPKAAKLAQGIALPLMEAYASGTADSATTIIQVMSEGGDDLLNLISLGINKPRSFLDALGFDDGVALTGTFLKVNLDFFTQRVMPQLKKHLPQVGQD